MQIHAYIRDGVVSELIVTPEGMPHISKRYHPDFVASTVDITRLIPQPQVGWLYSAELDQFSEEAQIV